jgi:hypothetical protein
MALKHLAILGALAALVSTASLAQQVTRPGAEPAQLAPPPGAPWRNFPGAQSCAPHYQRLLKLQIDGLRQLQRLSRERGDTLCSTLESADAQSVDKLVDPKALQKLLTPEQRELMEAFGFDLAKVDVARIMRLLGIDASQIDLRQLKDQCRRSQGDIDRFATSELRRLEDETIRCDNRI